MNRTNLCRSCMTNTMADENENFSDVVADMFYTCTHIKISKADDLPRQFCNECKIKIETSYNFIVEAQKADITLRNIFSRTGTSVIVGLEEHMVNIHDRIIESVSDVNLLKNKVTNLDKNLISDFPQFVPFDYNDSSHYIDKESPTIKEKISHIQENIVNNSNNNNKGCFIKNMRDEKNICQECGKIFMSSSWLRRHLEIKHNSQKYTCDQCSESFLKRSALKYHLVSHSDERNYKCNSCSKCFKHQKHLAAHMKGHIDDKPFSCDICKRRFKVKSVWKRHMNQHQDKKQYLCYFCGWSFAQASNLKTHIRRHTDERPFSCSRCEYSTRVSSALRRHERRHADTPPTHRCPHCKKGFHDSGNLARHTRTHTGELPYKCPYCTRAFTDSWKRKGHMTATHKVALSEIPRMRPDGQVI